MSPKRLGSCPCHLHAKLKMMLLQRQTEVRLYLIKFSAIRLVPVYTQEVLKSDLKDSKFQLIIPNFSNFTNLWDFPTVPQMSNSVRHK